ncbi:hypothetical protein ACOMHN_022063 [Nucella lapillus]
MALLYPLGVLCVIHLLRHDLPIVQADSVKPYDIYNTHLNNISFSENILFPFTSARSMLECARHCATHLDCLAFTYIPRSGSACQGYAVQVAAGDPSEYLPSARTFAFIVTSPAKPDVLTSDCLYRSDCVKRMSDLDGIRSDQPFVCFKQQCLCPIGYFYSVSEKICLRDCPKDQLQSTYTLYPGSGLLDTNAYMFTDTADQCFDRCTATPDCQNFEVSDTDCRGFRVVDASMLNDSKQGWNYYQRNCV